MATITAERRLDVDADRALRIRTLLFSLIAGTLLTILWSYTFVDSVIGGTIADTLLGQDAATTNLTGPLMGIVFAFVSGLAGTFTACNIAGMSAVAPMLAGGEPVTRRGTLVAMLRPIGWLALGMSGVAAIYGAIGAVMGDRLPQLSAEVTGSGMPVRLIQSSVVFGIVGLAFAYLGLAALRMVPDPLERFRARHPRTDVVVMGLPIGAFLIGRPFPLFKKMFEYAASTGNPLLGAGTFVLQAIGNIVIMTLLFVLLFTFGGGRFRNWLQASPGRIGRFTGGALIAAGSFTFFYWVLRVPSIFGYGWWPKAPWS